MENIPVADARTFAVMGHTGSGKTTLVDALLFKLGLNDRLGLVDNGSSMADFTEEEKGRKITIVSKPFAAPYKATNGKQRALTFVDTPGYMDFYGQVISACRATGTALIAVDAVSGVQVGTRQVWKHAKRAGLARGFVVTGLDRDNANFDKVIGEIQSTFGNGCVPVVLPADDASSVVDVLAAQNVPDDMAAQVEEAKGALVELAAETDDTLIEKFLGGEDLSPDEIAAGLHVAVDSGGLCPIFVAMPLKDIGVTELLDGICRLFRSPLDREIKDKEGNVVNTAEDAPFTGFVWRSVNDPFVGQLNFVRVLGGTLKGDCELQNTSREHKERMGNMLRINGKKQEAVSEATPGDIVAIPKLKNTHVGDTLCAAGGTTVMDAIRFPKPVMFQAVEALTQADEDKIGLALTRVCEEDPTLHVDRNAQTHEVVLQGLGDVHIDVAVGMMKSRSNVSVSLSTPKVPYMETVTAMGEGHYKHKKQSGGRGQYGEVYLRVEPLPEGDEDAFVNAIVGGVIPGNFIPGVQKGLVDGMTSGSVAGYPVTKVKATLYDGSYHDVDSSEVAFKIAGSRALREAMAAAKPVLLEPIMTVKITIPDHALGDINGDLNHKRGRIMGMEADEGMQVLTAEVPKAELFRYAAELRSMTAGQGSFEMDFCRYEVVPANVTQKVVAEAEKEKSEE
ncbi:MAG: elongation factor G [Kiritimatiellae bacterium]|nr:elongation factor G [Kiritimatiellia bacterium]